MTKETQDLNTILEERCKKMPIWEEIYYVFYRRWRDMRFWLTKELPCFFARGKKGYSYIDTWSFDAYLCGVIAGGVELLKNNLCGAPHELFDHGAENPTWKWKEVLDKIRDGFIAGKALIDADYMAGYSTREEWEPKQKELTDKFNEGMDLFKEYFFHLWD